MILTAYAGLIALCLTFSVIAWFRPHIGIFTILLLPLAGEFGRVQIIAENGILLSDILIGIFIGIWFIKKIPAIKNFKKTTLLKQIQGHPYLKPLIIFSIIGVASLVGSLSFLTPREVLASSLYLIRFIEYTFLGIATTDIIKSEKEKKYTVGMMVLTATLIAAVGFIQLVVYPDLGKLVEAGWDPHKFRLVSTWLDPNFIGGYLTFIMMFLISIGLYTQKLTQKIGLITLIIILGIGLFLTYSRSAYIAFGVGILIISFLKSKKILIAALIILIMGLSFSSRARERLSELLQSARSVMTLSTENADPTARLRIESWKQTWSLITKRPILGSGYNTLRSIKLDEGFVNQTATHSASGSESSIFTILATTGILGFITFLMLYWNMLKLAFCSWQKKESSNFKKAFGLGMLSGIISLFVHSFFINSLLFPQILISFWISAGLLIDTNDQTTMFSKHHHRKNDLS